jgi:hypothetical protein
MQINQDYLLPIIESKYINKLRLVVIKYEPFY